MKIIIKNLEIKENFQNSFFFELRAFGVGDNVKQAKDTYDRLRNNQYLTLDDDDYKLYMALISAKEMGFVEFEILDNEENTLEKVEILKLEKEAANWYAGLTDKDKEYVKYFQNLMIPTAS